MRLLVMLIGAVSLHAGILTFGNSSPASATEGALFNGLLGTFTDSNSADSAGDLSGTINWGDGTPLSVATIQGSAGQFSLNGAHTYVEEGDYTTQLSVSDDAGDFATATGLTVVSDAPLSVNTVVPFGFTPGVLFANIVLLTFSDANPNGSVADFSAIVFWGDGTTASVGTITPGGADIFDVTGEHVYVEGGEYTVSVDVQDAGGSMVMGQTTALGSSAPEPGSIGMVCAGLALVTWRRRARRV